jgi:hypothetical protein
MITGVPFNRILVDYLSMAISPAKPLFSVLSEEIENSNYGRMNVF